MATQTTKPKIRAGEEPRVAEIQFLDNFPPNVTTTLPFPLPGVTKNLSRSGQNKKTTTLYHFSPTLPFETYYLLPDAQEGDSAC